MAYRAFCDAASHNQTNAGEASRTKDESKKDGNDNRRHSIGNWYRQGICDICSSFRDL